MARTLNSFTGVGDRSTYPVSFGLGFISREHVYVYTGELTEYDTQLSYTWSNSNTIELDEPLTDGQVMYIRRVVPRNKLINDYEDGAILRESNLDASFAQALMILEEIQDGFFIPNGFGNVTFDENNDYNIMLNGYTYTKSEIDDFLNNLEIGSDVNAGNVKFTGTVDYSANNVEDALEQEYIRRKSNTTRLTAVEGNVVANNQSIGSLNSELATVINRLLVVENRSLSNTVDISSLSNSKISKDVSATVGNIPVFTEDGSVEDSGSTLADALSSSPDYIQEELPSDNVKNGARWYKPSEATTFIYYQDEDSGQWVQESVQSAEGTLRSELAAADSDVLVGGVEAGNLASRIADVRDFGAVGDGVADDTPAIQSALDSGIGLVYFPTGIYLCTSSLEVSRNTTVFGAAQERTKIKSEVVGDSLIKIKNNGLSFFTLRDITLEGNGLSGTSGNGHAINFIDPNIGSGAFTPQFCVVENVLIDAFNGLDVAKNGVDTIPAQGIIQIEGLQNTYRNVTIQNCGGGFFLDSTQNVTIDMCVVSHCEEPAAFILNTEVTRIVNSDLINSGSATLPLNYGGISTHSGCIVSQANEGLLVTGTKVKNTSGKALVVSALSDGDVFNSNWFSASMLSDVPHKAIYAERSPGLKLINNTFAPVSTPFRSSQKYQQVEIINTQTNEQFPSLISGNTFLDVSEFDIEYNIRVAGNNIVRNMASVSIINNNFGSRAGRSGASTVFNDILIETCAFINGEISHNCHYAAANVTRAVCIEAVGANTTGTEIKNNSFVINTGVISNDYVNIYPTSISSTGSPEGVVTANVGAIYSRTDGGSGTTLYVKESGSGNTGWIAK